MPRGNRSLRASALLFVMKRPAQPEEIAPAYVFLAAPAMPSYITGEIIPILGGYAQHHFHLRDRLARGTASLGDLKKERLAEK